MSDYIPEILGLVVDFGLCTLLYSLYKTTNFQAASIKVRILRKFW